jgi:hypothetical protein
MKPERVVVFREKSYRRYLENQQKIVLLKLVQPKLFPYFWGLLALLALLTGLAWSAEVPATIGGTGLVTRSASSLPQRAEWVVLAMLPPASLGQLRPGRKVLVELGDTRPALTARISKVEPAVLSPDAIRRRFRLQDILAGLLTGPAAVAIAQVDATTGQLRLAGHDGGRCRVVVEIASRRILNLVPGVSSLF